MTYLTYGVSTTSRTIYETPTLFPKVTFCNYNYFTTKYGYDVIQSENYSNIVYYQNDDKKRISHDLDEILLECWFSSTACSSSDFVWSYDSMYGNCYTFNSGFDSNGNKVELKKSILSDTNVLRLTLYVNIYEKIIESDYFKYNIFYNGLGAYFFIQNSSYLEFYNPISITPGLKSKIFVNREFKSILPKPYSNCDIDSSFK